MRNKEASKAASVAKGVKSVSKQVHRHWKKLKNCFTSELMKNSDSISEQ